MDDLVLLYLHATDEAEPQERFKEFLLTGDREVPQARISIQFSRLNMIRGTINNGSYAFCSQCLCALAS